MISVRSRNGWELGLEMGEAELEEGEALSCNEAAGGGDSSVDPDVSLSYIDEKLHNVLGHFQKDFEGIVSAENLGAKYGHYGSFLPTYQRSPSWSHYKRTPEATHSDLPAPPRKIPEVRTQKPKVSTSPSWRSREALGKAISLENSLRGNGHRLPNKQAENPSSSAVTKLPANPYDQRGLKVRIKFGSENLMQKNAEKLYSGLGLEISPSSSLDASPTRNERNLHGVEESPSTILRIMTSFPVDSLLLSPLPGSLITLTENTGLQGKFEDKAIEVVPNGSLSSKNSPRVLKSSEENEKEADVDILGCEELVSNALKLPLLRDSYHSDADPSKGSPDVKVQGNPSLKEHLIREPIHESYKAAKKLGRKSVSRSKLPESKSGSAANNVAASPQNAMRKTEKAPAFEQLEPDTSTRNKALDNKSSVDPYESSVATEAISATEGGSKRSIEKLIGKRKEKKIVHITGSQKSDAPKDQSMAVVPSTTPKSLMKSGANSMVLPKNDSRYPLGDKEKHVNLYKDFFGDHEFEEDDKESISGDITSVGQLGDPQRVSKRSSSESHSTSKELRDAKTFGKPHPSEKHHSVGSQVAPSSTTGHVPEAPASMLPPNEDWVCCDKCAKWRLLPLGTNPNDLPHKWVCRMLTWLPGMNRCNVPENETTNALRALYNPVASVIGPTSDKQQFLLSTCGQDFQDAATRSAPSTGKKKPRPTNTASLGGVSGHQHMPEFSGQASKSADKEKSSLVYSDKGTNIKVRSKRESEVEDSRASKRVRSAEPVKDLRESGAKDVVSLKDAKMHSRCKEDKSLLHSSRSDASRDSRKKRKSTPLTESGGFSDRASTPVQREQESDFFTEHTSENERRREKKARVSKSVLKDPSHGSKFSSGTDSKGRSTTMKHPFIASHSSSDKAKLLQGSPVESVSSSPLRFAGSEKLRPAKKNRVEKDDFHEPRSLTYVSGLDKDNVKATESSRGGFEHLQANKEQPNSRKNKPDEHSVTLKKGEKFEDKKCDVSLEPTNEKLRGKKDLAELTGTERAKALPPPARVQTENVLNGNAFENGDGKKAQILRKQSEKQNTEAASPLQRDSSSHAANSALKEAKDLKHLADRLKGSDESNGFYFQAALKFLHGASLLESGSSESTKHNDLMKSMQIYSSTAKLCEFCALNYEKANDMAAASLAYKCVEVAYMRVIYSSNPNASRDRNDLQRALQIVPTGESPSSSASDIDNMNNQTSADKAALAIVSLGSPNVSGSHTITSRSRAGFLRLLNFAQDVNSAMEASRKSRNAFSAATSKPAETGGISSLKKAIDFNFQDIEALLLLVRVAMEATGH